MQNKMQSLVSYFPLGDGSICEIMMFSVSESKCTLWCNAILSMYQQQSHGMWTLSEPHCSLFAMGGSCLFSALTYIFICICFNSWMVSDSKHLLLMPLHELDSSSWMLYINPPVSCRNTESVSYWGLTGCRCLKESLKCWNPGFHSE